MHGAARFPIICKPFPAYWLAGVLILWCRKMEDDVFSLLMKTFCHSFCHSTHLSNLRRVFFCECWKKLLCLDVFLCSALSCDSTCLAPCCECSHWAVITHLTADWNIHSQVSPSLGVTHMDSLLSPPSALTQRSPPPFCCTSLCSQRLATPSHNHPELSMPWALNATVPLRTLIFSLFLCSFSDSVGGILLNSG